MIQKALSVLMLVLPASALAVPFTPGEEIVFQIEALGMSAGRARISVGTTAERDGRQAWPIVVWGRTDSLFDRIYTVRDKFVSWWEPSSGRVIGADFYADEGGKKHRSRSSLDHDTGKAEVRREKAGKRSVNRYTVPPGAFDIAGALMALRGYTLEPGTVLELPVFTGKKVFMMRCTVEGTDTVKNDVGTFQTVVTRIQLGFDGKFASKRDLRVWFTQDDQRIPVRMEAEFVLGKIVAQLTSYRRGISL